MTGFCWSSVCGPRRGGGWAGPTALLCVYGFSSMLRPTEPFLTAFLIGPYKNLTVHQVTEQVLPVWAYSSLLLLIPVFLLTDPLRYKPVIVLQALSNVLAVLLLLFCTGVSSAQGALFVYSLATAADVAYFSYIYTVVHPGRYQRVTSYARAAVLLGYAAGAALGQLLVSLWGVVLYWLAVTTLVSLCLALSVSFLLPMPGKSLFRRETLADGGPGDDGPREPEGRGVSWGGRAGRAGREAAAAVRRLWRDCRECYSSVAVRFFCVWVAAGRCGFYQVSSYVQLLWEAKQPRDNFTAYNGGVDAFATLSGAAASVAVGHVALDWSVWGELFLGVFTALLAGALYLMELTCSIWVCYGCYALFKTVYMLVITVCTFQIARNLSRERYALVFGLNFFMGTALQSLLTAIVVSSLRMAITTQFVVYASYFAAISVLFLLRGVHTVLRVRHSPGGRSSPADRQSETSPDVTEVPHT
ncbi:thiamine transporter 1-like [Osmerus eperlanus]|uniref:thiamine transporter 1-like n=1 Tax=Osmerus eperlanus TaxID=29151 RepID=UPI002E0DFDA4